MITLESADVFGHTIFCDDIRIEASGKFIYIGVYPSYMTWHGTFPFILPHLALSISYSQRPEKFITPNFWVFLPGDPDDKPSLTSEMPEEAARQALERVQNSALPVDKGHIYANTVTNFMFQSVPIKTSGLIKVRAVRGEELFRLGTLFVQATGVAPQSQEAVSS
jgi:hypothetical protein